MEDQKTISTCLRLPEDVRDLASKVGNGNITEGISTSVRFVAAMTERPESFDPDHMVRTIIELSHTLSAADIQLAQAKRTIETNEKRIHILEGKLQERDELARQVV